MHSILFSTLLIDGMNGLPENGGTGFSFSKLRPAGDIVSTTGGQASGPVSFMRIYDTATENIRQGGRRRGANMGILRVDHPDIEEFINVKRDGRSLRNFNLSVGVTDEFMSAVEKNAVYDLRHPTDLRVVKQRSARDVFHSICYAPWETGDPGLIFLDAIERGNPTPLVGRMESTNPCGELPLLANESCNLGSINLPHFVKETDGRPIDWDRLRATTQVAVRFLDDVITINEYPTEAIANATLSNRKIGLGVMGFAELCILLDICYASNEAVALAGNVISCMGVLLAINSDAHSASQLEYVRYGVYMARRGWVQPQSVVNTWPLAKLQRWLRCAHSQPTKPLRNPGARDKLATTSDLFR